MADQVSQIPAGAVRRPVCRPEISAHELDDELVLYDPRSGEAYVLNRTAAQVWSLCDGVRTTTSLAGAISASYALPYQQALDDVGECLGDFQQAGLITLV